MLFYVFLAMNCHSSKEIQMYQVGVQSHNMLNELNKRGVILSSL